MFGGNITPNEKNPEDIPKEELIQLCMKMNKRMQAMETKGKELVKKKTSLLSDRRKLLDLILTVVKLPMNTLDDQKVDMALIENSWNQWDASRREHEVECERKVALIEHTTSNKIQLLETKYRHEIELLKSECHNDGNSVNSSAIVDSASNKADGQTSTMELLLNENEALKLSLMEIKAQCSKFESDIEHRKGSELRLKQQLDDANTQLAIKSQRVEEVQKDLEAHKLNFEEKLLHLQMQSNTQKSREENKDKEIVTLRKQAEKLTAQFTALSQLTEEKDMSVRSNKEMISALQARLIELEPELAHAKDRLRDGERNSSAITLLRAEQDALLSSLRRDLKSALEGREESQRRIQELEEYRAKTEGHLLRMTALSEQVAVLQTSIEDKNSFIARLRTEAQTSERNHAMRTAMLATCEAQLEATQKDLTDKDATNKELIDRITELQTAVTASETRLGERVREFEDQLRQAEQKASDLEKEHAQTLSTLRTQHLEAMDSLKKDHAKKSAMARTLLSEREEDVRLLTAKVQEQHEEIVSGAPNERKIFELAKQQAKREATHGIHSDTREVAFQQLQSALAAKDLELARHQQSLSHLTAEATELRRTQKRDGINMDYLKNVVIQYMTLPMQSSEKLSLVSVIAMLLQFTPKELSAVQKSDRDPVWGSRPAKEVKRMASLPKTPSSVIPGSSSSSQHVSPAGIIVGSNSNNNNTSDSADSSGNSNGGYIPPYSNSVSFHPTTIGGSDDASTRGNNGNSSSPNRHQSLSKHLEMSESDYDFHEKLQTLESMDVLNISSSDPDLAGKDTGILLQHPRSMEIGLVSQTI